MRALAYDKVSMGKLSACFAGVTTTALIMYVIAKAGSVCNRIQLNYLPQSFLKEFYLKKKKLLMWKEQQMELPAWQTSLHCQQPARSITNTGGLRLWSIDCYSSIFTCVVYRHFSFPSFTNLPIYIVSQKQSPKRIFELVASSAIYQAEVETKSEILP